MDCFDPTIGAHVLGHENMRMPQRDKYYPCNEANAASFPEPYQTDLERLRNGATGRECGSRYIGSLIADFHRTLLKGGVCLYPPTTNHPEGKLRLLYEANPLAFIAERAGGMAIDGDQPILSLRHKKIHEGTPLVVGGRSEVEAFLECASCNA